MDFLYRRTLPSRATRQYPFLLPFLLLALSTLAWSQTPARTKQSRNGNAHASSVARGKYIVEGIAMCTQCHTPRTSAGALDTTKWLQGAPLWLRPATSIADWPLNAPRLAGLVPGSDDDMVKLLTTGIWRDGNPPRPPMPQFRLTRQDAEAVVTYLKSLSPSPEH
jgi:mono/diheme cytochrome c family protein